MTLQGGVLNKTFWKLVHNTGCAISQLISPLLSSHLVLPLSFPFTPEFLNVILPFLYLTALEYEVCILTNKSETSQPFQPLSIFKEQNISGSEFGGLFHCGS